MTSKFKRPGVLRASFDYQDLCAIDVLVDFWRQPDVYAWVELDSDDPKFESVDDVVACRVDGRFEITQVKFTVDPDEPGNRLDWDWLLRRKGRGRSLLQKWSRTVAAHARGDLLERAELRTDRRPDADFAAVLDGDRVDPSRIAPGTADLIVGQLGSRDEMERFFADFSFRHSQPHIDDLEYDLRARLIPSDTDEEGWFRLARAAKDWATFRARPAPDGRVRHWHMRAVLSRQRPRPLPQDFEVPAGYGPPDAEFDAAFLRRVRDTDGVTVLWGSPGRGKSTYLSHCHAILTGERQVCIRHHYFLRLSDRGTSRFFYQDIERSLIRQIEEQLPDLDVPGMALDSWLEAAAARAERDGRRLVITIDGLDHVWREGRSLEHMHLLFATMLPLPPNVHLVVGTQRIAVRHLPTPLTRHAPQRSWLELPLMSAGAIRHWMEAQCAGGRLTVEAGLDPGMAMRDLSEAFHSVTGGLPLQLIYAFETLQRVGAPLSAAKVRGLPMAPTGNIRDYYRALWGRVSPGAKSILHGLADVGFALPPGGIHQCFRSMPGAPEAIEEIDHLLDHRETGIYPFHGSIFVFVREQRDHRAIATAQRPAFLAWLDGPAPAYWRWAWSWVTRARFGDDAPLRSGPDRQWTLAALRSGKPLGQIEHVIQEAEALAVRALDFARATELRSLWIRVSNAPEFQTSHFADFVEATLRGGDCDFRFVQLRSELYSATPEVMMALLRALEAPAAGVTAGRVLAELNRRARESLLDPHSRTDWPAVLVKVVAHLPDVDFAHFGAYARRLGRSDQLIAAALDEAILAGRYAAALGFARLHRGPECDRGLFALLCLDGHDPRPDIALRGHAANPLFHALYAVRGWTLPRRRPLTVVLADHVPSTDGFEARAAFGGRLRTLFFRIVSAAVGGRSTKVRLEGLDAVGDPWVRKTLGEVAAAARRVAAGLDAGAPPPSPAEFIDGLDVPRQRSLSYDAQSLVTATRLALRDIALDLQLLRRAADPAARVGPGDLPPPGHLWDDALWLARVGGGRYPVHSPFGAAALLDRLDAVLDAEVTEFMERSDLSVQAALFALDHGLAANADRFLARTARCLLGYGWRKDPFAFEVLTALRLLHAHDPAWATDRFLRLAPAYDAITEYTDGDETNHARNDYFEGVLDFLPGRAGALYGTLIRADEWYYAETFVREAAKRLDPADPHDAAVLATFIQRREIRELRGLAAAPSRAGEAILIEVLRKVGFSRPPAPRDRGDSTTYSTRVPRSAPAPARFPPGELAAYREAVRAARGYGWKDRAFERWLRHWSRAGRGVEALAALKRLVEGDHSSIELDRTYDLAFTISLRLEGSQAAFPWLVAAQRHRHGWQRWYASAAEAERRLALAARHYRDRWSEFVLASSEPVVFNPGERTFAVLGQGRLVGFLLSVGELDRARALTGVLVETMIAEVEEQPLRTPRWAA